MTAAELLHAGQLAAAVAAATEGVRAKPADRPMRRLLAELLFVSGDLERADKQFAVLDTDDAPDRISVRVWRQCLRAEAARRDVFTQGRLPTFLAEPAEHVRLTLEALVATRAGDRARAEGCVRAAEAARPITLATVDGRAAAPVRDEDDICAGIVEAFGADGEYYWVPFEQIAAIEFAPPGRAAELAARPAKWSLRSGQIGEVVLPAVYWNSAAAGDAFALGRTTDTPAAEVVRGVGQREWRVGDESLPFLALKHVHFGEAKS